MFLYEYAKKHFLKPTVSKSLNDVSELATPAINFGLNSAPEIHRHGDEDENLGMKPIRCKNVQLEKSTIEKIDERLNITDAKLETLESNLKNVLGTIEKLTKIYEKA